MGKRSRRPAVSRQGKRRRATVSTSTAPNLAQLERRFAEFRREHPPQTRIPDSLRDAVLVAMRQGVTAADLRRCCGLGSNQIEYWQKSLGEIQAHTNPAVQNARVFSVVGDMPVPDVETTDHKREQRLELRLDGWSISIRRDEP